MTDEVERALESLENLDPRELSSPPSCTNFQATKQVLLTLKQSSANYNKCSAYLVAISGHTSTLKTRFGVVNKVVKVVKPIVSKLSSTVTTVYNSANAILNKLTALPKIGQIIKLALKVLQVIKIALARADSLVGKVAALFSKLSTAFKTVAYTMTGLVGSSQAAAVSSNMAATLTQLSMTCTTKTPGCADDQAVETHNVNFAPMVTSASQGGAACANTLGTIANLLQTIVNALKESLFNAIQAAVEQLEKVLQPIITMIEKVVSQVTQKLNEVYCCTTSLHLQGGLKLLGQVMDMATCPLDGAIAGIESALTLLEDELNKLINQLLSKLLQPVANVEVAYPQVQAGSVDPVSCKIVHPSIVMKKVNPFAPWLEAVKDDKPSTEVFKHAAFAFGNGIKDACNAAAGEFGKNLNKDCCIFHKPLSDGKFCDPTNIIPYKKCSQCTSGRNTWWFDRSHVACGKTPCGKDGARCGVGTSCKNCCNGHSYWDKLLFTACGREPCWGDGARCALGTTCKNCCNSATFWASKVFTACGRDPCWGDGTRCGAGTSCKKCCAGRHMHWYSVGMTACGSEPCWGGGKRCAGGTSCRRCCHGSKWIMKKFGHFCK